MSGFKINEKTLDLPKFQVPRLCQLVCEDDLLHTAQWMVYLMYGSLASSETTVTVYMEQDLTPTIPLKTQSLDLVIHEHRNFCEPLLYPIYTCTASGHFLLHFFFVLKKVGGGGGERILHTMSTENFLAVHHSQDMSYQILY